MLRELAGFDEALRPLSPNQIARREAIAREMARVAKSSEAYLPPDERRGVFDLAELRAVAYECAVVTPFAALGTLGYLFCLLPS